MITASPTAPLGSVTTLEHYAPSDFTSSDVILCRNTAPLITLAFGFIQRHVGCRVLGREIGTNLVTLIRACKTDDIAELETKLISRRNREVAKARASGSESAVAAIEDKYDCLNIFINANDSVEDVCDAILRLFDDKAQGLLTLSTIHKAKGLEWPTVFILDWNLLPSRWATQPWQQTQERNLQYVAVTRAKLYLKFITSNCWRKEGETKCVSTNTPVSSIAPGPANTPDEESVSVAPPPTFNPDAVDAVAQPITLERAKQLQAEYIERYPALAKHIAALSSRLTPNPDASLSCDPSADSAWLTDHIYDSVRKASNPDEQ